MNYSSDRRRLLRHAQPVYLLVLAATVQPAAATSADLEVRPDTRSPYYTHRSDRSVGDRGEVTLDVSVAANGCGEQWRYHAAEILIKANRFGDAQFVALPEPGCVDCKEIVIRWMHEPTGHIEFDVNVSRERHFESCRETE